MTKLIVNILKTFIFTLHNDLTLHVLMSNRNLQAYIVSLNENCYLSEKANGCWPKSTYGASSFDEKSWRPSWPFAAIDHRIQAKIHSVFFFEKWRQFWFWKDLPPSFSHLRAAILFFFFVVVAEWKIASRDGHSSPIVVKQVVSLIKVRCDARATIYPIQIAIKFMLELCWHSSVIIYNCSLFIVMTTQYIRECLPETDTST